MVADELDYILAITLFKLKITLT